MKRNENENEKWAKRPTWGALRALAQVPPLFETTEGVWLSLGVVRVDALTRRRVDASTRRRVDADPLPNVGPLTPAGDSFVRSLAHSLARSFDIDIDYTTLH